MNRDSEENETNTETQAETSEDSSNKDDTVFLVSGHKEVDVSSEVDTSHHEEEESGDMKATTDDPVVASTSGEDSGHEHLVDETGDSERTTGPVLEEDNGVDISFEEHMQRLQWLFEEEEKASHQISELHVTLAEYLGKKMAEVTKQEQETPVSEQLQEVEKHVSILAEVKQQLAAESETVQQRTDKLNSLSKQRLEEVEKEGQAFVALKRQVAVKALSKSLGKQAAQAKVEATLEAERLLQNELTALTQKQNRLSIRVGRLEREVRDREEHSKDPLQLQFDLLQAARQEQTNKTEKHSEELSKLENKINSSLEILANVKEKQHWTQVELQAMLKQLPEVEAMVVSKRDRLSRTKQERIRLQRDNQRLKESCGLLGSRVLLRDYEDTVDASVLLEDKLETLKLTLSSAVADGAD